MENNQLLRDVLTGALIGIARAVDGNEHLISAATNQIVQEGLSALLHDPDGGSLSPLIQRVKEEKKRLIPNCYECAAPCGKNNDYDMQRLAEADEEVRSLKLLLLSGTQWMSVYARRAAALGRTDPRVDRFFYQALFAIGEESFGTQELLQIIMKYGEIHSRCMDLLNK